MIEEEGNVAGKRGVRKENIWILHRKVRGVNEYVYIQQPHRRVEVRNESLATS